MTKIRMVLPSGFENRVLSAVFKLNLSLCLPAVVCVLFFVIVITLRIISVDLLLCLDLGMSCFDYFQSWKGKMVLPFSYYLNSRYRRVSN